MHAGHGSRPVHLELKALRVGHVVGLQLPAGEDGGARVSGKISGGVGGQGAAGCTRGDVDDICCWDVQAAAARPRLGTTKCSTPP